MTLVKIKRVYEPEEKADGYRVFVDRLWPRGVKKEDFHYDLWAKAIAPSTPLRQWFREDEENHWKEFKKKYVQELKASDAIKELVEKIKEQKTVTLLFASKNVAKDHTIILQEYLDKALKQL